MARKKKEKTVSVKWNGQKDDPDEITQDGVHFVKGEWTDVPEDKADKLENNPWFEVKGSDSDLEPPVNSSANAFVSETTSTPGTVYAGSDSYEASPVVEGGKTTGWIVVPKNGATPVANSDVYSDQDSAQAVADAMNKVAPVKP